MWFEMAARGARTPVLILKEGSSRTKGRAAQKNNVLAAKLVGEIVKSSLGPRGMDKMLVDTLGDVTISADGATILKEMDVRHPAGKIMVEIAKAQDSEVNDGTTSVVVLASELLSLAEKLREKKVHPTVIVEGYGLAAEKALETLKNIGIKVSPTDRETLRRVALTAMASKLVSEESPHLAEIAVDAVLKTAEAVKGEYRFDFRDVKFDKKPGESLSASQIVQGIAIDKEIAHPSMPKRIVNAKIALVSGSIEIKKTETYTRLNIDRPEQMTEYQEQEKTFFKEMVDKVKEAGADVLLCEKGIEDLPTYLLAKEGIAAVERVRRADSKKLERATGGRRVTRVEDLTPESLGFAKLVEERKVGEDKWVFIEGCKNPRSTNIVIRGGSEMILDEAERSVIDAVGVVWDILQKPLIVAGGGAIEMEMAMEVRKWAGGLKGRKQLAAMKFAEALEVIPRALAENSGLDPIDIMTELRARHEKGERWAGVNAFKGKVTNMRRAKVLEPSLVKEQMIKSAVEAATLILRIDDLIAKKRSPEVAPAKPGRAPFTGPMPPSAGPMHPSGPWKKKIGKSPYPPKWEEEWYETHTRWH
ncbi:MAG: thermosome subunit beta [Candidatus Geothermarchaeales archaeon]